MGLRGVFHACFAALALAAFGAAVHGCAGRAGPPVLGVDLPLAGPDGAEGILALQAVRLALDQHVQEGGRAATLELRDAAAGGFANPHEDEGAGNWHNPEHAARNAASLAADPNVRAAIGGFSNDVARAEREPAVRAHLPLVIVNAPAMNGSASAAVFQFSHTRLAAQKRAHFDESYRARYQEAPDDVAARYYGSTRIILRCLASSRDEVANCLRRVVRWSH